jgi:hypothetical protein
MDNSPLSDFHTYFKKVVAEILKNLKIFFCRPRVVLRGNFFWEKFPGSRRIGYLILAIDIEIKRRQLPPSAFITN